MGPAEAKCAFLFFLALHCHGHTRCSCAVPASDNQLAPANKLRGPKEIVALQLCPLPLPGHRPLCESSMAAPRQPGTFWRHEASGAQGDNWLALHWLDQGHVYFLPSDQEHVSFLSPCIPAASPTMDTVCYAPACDGQAARGFIKTPSPPLPYSEGPFHCCELCKTCPG